MAGWADIVNAGEIEAGYVLDIKFFNAYINALKEKSQFINRSLVAGLDTIDDTKSFIPTKSFIQDIIESYRLFMVVIDWIKADRFDNPGNYGPIDDDSTGVWTQAEIETHIGSTAYNIINDPYDSSLTIVDLNSATVWNALYKLYKDIFIYVDQREIRSSVLSWEDYGAGDTGLIDNLQNCPAVNPGSDSCITTDLETFATNYESSISPMPVINSGSGRKMMEAYIYIEARQSKTFNLPLGDGSTDDYFTYKRSIMTVAYSKRKHTIKNFNDDLVALGYAAQNQIIYNRLKDTGKGLTEQIVAWDNDYDMVTDTYPQPPSPVNEFNFESSVLTATHWELTGDLGPAITYEGRRADFLYDVATDIPLAEESNGGSASTERDFLYHARAGSDYGESDFYYKTNVPEMVYYIAP